MTPLKGALRVARRGGWAAAVLAAILQIPARGEETGAAAEPAARLLYVIKVTPTLVYLDAGAEGGAADGQEYQLLREDAAATAGYVPVGIARVIRLADGFCIAEIAALAPGEEAAVLQRAVLRGTWEQMVQAAAAAGREPFPEPSGPGARPAPAKGARCAYVLAGAELGKAIHLRRTPGGLMGAAQTTDAAIAVRLARAFARRWRLGLTYRVAGEPLGMPDADVTQLAVEADLHLLLRGLGRATPYLGAGAGMHQLSWETPAGAAGPSGGDLGQTAYKLGLNAMAGFELPAGDGWALLVELGYQRVKAWDQTVDGSNLRLYAGLGRHF